MMATPSEQELNRILRRLSVQGARLVRDETNGVVLDALVARSLIVGRDGGFELTATGRAAARRAIAGADGFAVQHQERATAVMKDDNAGAIQVTINQNESPLWWLRSRRGRDGRPLINATEFSAGERLRSDYERGHIIPRVTANWTASVAGGRRAGGVAELTEAAIGARQRVEKALDAVGPEYSGLLIDFCCFLKGLEEIERERQWPSRSAKVVLRLGLSTLARHYGLAGEGRGHDRSVRMRHWGTEDYRPTMD